MLSNTRSWMIYGIMMTLVSLWTTTTSSAFLNLQPILSSSRTIAPPTTPLNPLFAMAQPETQIKTKTTVKTSSKQKVEIKKKFKTDDPVQNRDDDFQDAPMYKVMLLADEDYDQEHVVTRLCAVVDDMDEDQAATVWKQAMASGKAMCGKYPYERAELFKEQLLRSDPMIFCDLVEENA